jgi:hypothetical protein
MFLDIAHSTGIIRARCGDVLTERDLASLADAQPDPDDTLPSEVAGGFRGMVVVHLVVLSGNPKARSCRSSR